MKEELLINANGVILKDIPLLNNNFSENSVRQIVYEMEEINMTPGDIIYDENDTNDQNLYIIRDGEVEIYKETYFDGKNNTSIKNLKKGEYFGEISFFTGMSRKASAKSILFSSLYVINKLLFLSIIKQNSEDYEKFCFIKDQINLYNDYSGIHIKCISCNKDNHAIIDCPVLHLILSYERILLKFTFSIHQQRLYISRKKLLKTSNSLKNFKQNLQKAKQITNDIYKSFIEGNENYSAESTNSEKDLTDEK